jgi:hypothetical protein
MPIREGLRGRLLVEKGIFTNEEFLEMVKVVGVSDIKSIINF